MDSLDEIMAQLDPAAFLDRVASQACVRFHAADGATISICDDKDCFVVVSAAGSLAPRRGFVIPIDRTFQSVALRSRRPVLVGDIAKDPRLTPEVRMIGTGLAVQSCLLVPLISGNQAIGVLALASRETDAFSEADIERVAATSDLISAMVNANAHNARLLRVLVDTPAADSEATARFLASVLSPEVAERERVRSAIDHVVSLSLLTTVFQPIVELRSRRAVAVEALSRLPTTPFPNTQEWFAAAYSVGRGVSLELHALRTALRSAEGVPTDFPVGINLSPTAALQPEAQRLLLSADRQLILELTEHQPALEPVREALEPLREHGIQIAVDDAGAGYSGLSQILKLSPDIIKLDGQLSANIHTDPARRALATAMVQFAGDIGARTIAEGIEHAVQEQLLRNLGIECGQGYLFGRPATLAELQIQFAR